MGSQKVFPFRKEISEVGKIRLGTEGRLSAKIVRAYLGRDRVIICIVKQNVTEMVAPVALEEVKELVVTYQNCGCITQFIK